MRQWFALCCVAWHVTRLWLCRLDCLQVYITFKTRSEYYEKFADFKQAIVGCIAETDGEYKQELASLLTLKFQTFENVPL